MSNPGDQDVGHFPCATGKPLVQKLCRVSVASILNTQASEGCEGHHNQTQKNNARGRQFNVFCQIRSARELHSGCFQAERDRRVIPATELGHSCQQSKQQIGKEMLPCKFRKPEDHLLKESNSLLFLQNPLLVRTDPSQVAKQGRGDYLRGQAIFIQESLSSTLKTA